MSRSRYAYFSAVKEEGSQIKADILMQMLVESGLARALGAALLATLPTSCSCSADPWIQFNNCANALCAYVSNALSVCVAADTMKRYGELCHLFIDSGCGTALCRYIEIFERSDPAEDSRVTPWLAVVIACVQMLASGGAAHRILTECCASPKALYTALIACSRRGGSCPIAFRNLRVAPKAGMCIGVLFGREEDEKGANTVPPEVTAEIVRQMKSIVDGEAATSPVNLADVLGCMSSSDANTDAMVRPSDGGIGVLEVFTMIMLQGESIVNSWANKAFRYNVPLAREKCAGVLLNLALSARTSDVVAQHAELGRAIDYALNDADNLTKTAKKLLNETLFQLKLVTGETEATHSKAALAAEQRHVMLSYAWAQQKLILRVRHALGQLGYIIWIDVEQMSGSTVDAMSSAVDEAEVVVSLQGSSLISLTKKQLQ